jgi:CheY-like chemotaxis protein
MSNYRALIVDDEYQVRYATARALGRVGFDCQLANDGRHALEFLRQAKFDLVVTDLKMPEVNGHKLATALLNLERPPAISVLTGVVEPKLAKDLTARGVERVFFKPVDYAEFASDLLALVERRRFPGDDSLEANQGSDANHVILDSSSQAVVKPGPLTFANDVVEKLPETFDREAEKQVPLSQVSDGCKIQSTDAPSGAVDRDEPESFRTYDNTAFLIKIEAELSRTRKSLLDLERTVAAGQNVSYFCLAIALAAGLISGLILGWLSSHLLAPVTTFR